MTDDITVTIPSDTHEIEVSIGAGAIKRAIERREEDNPARVTYEGHNSPEWPRDMSRFLKISVEPTDERWDELFEADAGATKCSRCDGKGYTIKKQITMNTKESCGRCEGKGYIYEDEEMQEA